MKKNTCFLFFIVFSLVLISPFISAEIKLSQPSAVYSLGDMLNISYSVIETSNLDGIIRLTLVCDGNSVDFYAKYIDVQAGKEFADIATLKVANTKGNCKINAKFASEEVSTAEFLASDSVISNVLVEKNIFNPGDKIVISGNATKANGKEFDGTLLVTYFGNKKDFLVTDGKFNIELNVPRNFAGSNTIEFLFSDNYNTGKENADVYVVSIPTSISLTTSKYDFNPIETVSAKAILYDQAGKAISGNLSLSLRDSKNKEIFAKEVKSNSAVDFEIPANAISGEWKLIAVYNDLKAEKIIFVKEYAALDVSSEGDKVVLTNIGNIEYNSSLNISFDSSTGNQLIDKSIVLEPGDSKELKLTAQNGTYDVTIGDKTFRGMSLTGGVTAALDVGKKLEFLGIPVSTVILFFVIVMIVAFLTSSRLRQAFFKPSKHYVEISTQISKLEQKLDTKMKEMSLEKERINKLFQKYAGAHPKAIEQVSMKGKKQQVTSMFVDIRGFSALTSKLGDEQALGVLNNYFKIVTDAVYGYKGIVNHIAGDGVFALFNVIEQQDKHEIAAIKAGLKIVDGMKKLGFDVGIGINSGNAIVGTIGSDRIVKFSAVGNSINLAQKIEEKSRNKVLITKEVYESIKNNLKAERFGLFNISGKAVELFEVTRVI